MGKYYSTTLQKGSKGGEVTEWQKFLQSQGYYNGSIDGDFGDITHAATVAYQKANGLGADGIVGKNTWGKAGYTPYSTASTPTAAPTPNPLPTNPTYDTTTYDSTTKGQATLDAYNTAKENVNNSDPFTYEDYVESDAVKGASDALNTHLANKPGEYQSQWQSQLDALMNSIMNRDKFSYDVNGDALYQQYKDKYIQQGKMAMADTMGQAAAMTGGYGNSYAQSVGQQAYQASLDNLNDIVPELYAMALEQYNREGQDLYNQYGMLADRENLDYARYRDQVSDFLTERDYLQGRYDTERGFDYGKYVDDRNLDYALHQDEYQRLMDALGIAQSDYYSGAEMFYNEQSNKNNVASQQFNDAMSIWSAETEQAWKQAEWDEAARQYLNDEAWKQKEWAENQRRYEESKTSSDGGNGSGGGGAIYNPDGTLKEGYTTNNESYFDKNGNFKKATFSRIDSNGNAVWYIDGKEVIRQQGANPYTGDVNPDTKNGTFSNGYQPNNVNGQKLSKSGITDTVNGVTQNVWKTPDGTLWIWDGTQNKYLKYGNQTAPTKTTGGGGGGGSRVKITLK